MKIKYICSRIYLAYIDMTYIHSCISQDYVVVYKKMYLVSRGTHENVKKLCIIIIHW